MKNKIFILLNSIKEGLDSAR